MAERHCAVVTKPFLVSDLLATLARLVAPSLDDPAAALRSDRRAQEITEPMIRPVVGLVDANGKGVTSRTAQLEQKGYKVVACRWGDGIFDMALCEQPDMLIVDSGDRPRRAVSYALRRLERDPLTGHIPIIMDPPDGEFYRRIEEIIGRHRPSDQRRGRHNGGI